MATYVGPNGVIAYPGYRPQSRRRGAVGTITGARGFNHFPEIIAAFPGALSAIVKETTEQLARDAVNAAPIGKSVKGAPAPGTLRKSAKTRYAKSRANGMVQTGRIDFKAVDPTREEPKHQYAWYVEWGTVHTPARHFLLPAIVKNRPVFQAKLRSLESRLPA